MKEDCATDSDSAIKEEPGVPGDAAPTQEVASVARLHERLSKVYHDLNNSLSVISGNAQLLSEMARADGLGPSFTEPLTDIEAAREEISTALTRLDRLRQEATQEGE